MLPAFQGKGIFAPLFKHTLVSTSKRFYIEGVVGEAVCSHTSVQKMSLELDFQVSRFTPCRISGVKGRTIDEISFASFPTRYCVPGKRRRACPVLTGWAGSFIIGGDHADALE